MVWCGISLRESVWGNRLRQWVLGHTQFVLGASAVNSGHAADFVEITTASGNSGGGRKVRALDGRPVHREMERRGEVGRRQFGQRESSGLASQP